MPGTRLLAPMVVGVLAAAWAVSPAAAADKPSYFDLTSPDFKDGGKLPLKYGGNNPQFSGCAGQNISPALNWKNPPPNTKSYMIMLSDTAGRPPLGVVHWLAYDLPATKMGFKEGEASAPSAEYKGGKSSMNLTTYFGPCPAKGQKAHPYVFTLAATDIAPGTLAAGMNQQELGAALQGHVLGSVSLVSRYGH